MIGTMPEKQDGGTDGQDLGRAGNAADAPAGPLSQAVDLKLY